MAKLSMIIRIFVLGLTLMIMYLPSKGHGSGVTQLGPEAVDKWFEKLPHSKKKLTKLHFYFHDVVSGKNPTAVLVAVPNNTVNPSPISFGAVVVIDDPLTLGPELDSKIIGRAQGIYSSVSQGEVGLLMALNYVFTDGKYNGSTLSILPHNSILQKYREMPILGGTGVFRLARGIATAQTYFFNTTSLDAVVEYDVAVMHY